MRNIYLSLLVLFCCAFAGNAQVKSAVATLVSSEGGNRQGVVCMKIKTQVTCMEWGSTSLTKFRGFEDGKAWTIGAKWRVTYLFSKKDDVWLLKSATYLRR